jgi:membrane protein DedA with SNARE-associated domain
VSGLVSRIFAALTSFIVGAIATLGYPGVVILMAFESAGVPLPSEVIMPFSGYLALTGRFTLWGAALAGGLGCLLGSLAAYWASAVGGRPLLERYGRYILISRHDLALADRWFARWGDATVFVGRLLPIVRTYISFPAGVARVGLWRFSFYTFVGSVIWSYLLAWIGMRLGERWASIREAFEGFELVIALLLVAGIIWWIRRHLRVRQIGEEA